MKKSGPQFFSNSIVGAPFLPKKGANHSKSASSLADRASNNKSEIVAHPTGHVNAHLEPTQQQTNNPAALD
jgi:hypothetical protein